MVRQGASRTVNAIRIFLIVGIATGLLLGSMGFATATDNQEPTITPTDRAGMPADILEHLDDENMVSGPDTEAFGAFVLLATYSKYNDISVLEHDAREEILGIIAAAPGIYFAHLVGRTGHPSSTVRYHTKILEREGMIQTENILGHLRLFKADIPSAAFAYLAAKRDPPTRRVLECIEDADGPVTSGKLSDAIDRAPSTVSYHLSRLEDESLITRTRNGEGVEITLAEEVSELDIDAMHQRSAAI